MARRHQILKKTRDPRPSPVDRRSHRGVTKPDSVTGRQVLLTAAEIAQFYGGRALARPVKTASAEPVRKRTILRRRQLSEMSIDEIYDQYGHQAAAREQSRRSYDNRYR